MPATVRLRLQLLLAMPISTFNFFTPPWVYVKISLITIKWFITLFKNGDASNNGEVRYSNSLIPPTNSYFTLHRLEETRHGIFSTYTNTARNHWIV